MVEIVKAPNLPRTCKGGGQHYLVSEEQLTADKRCKACQQARKRKLYQEKRKAESPDGRIYRKELPTWCYKLEHYLRSKSDVVGNGTRCKQCHREMLQRKRIAKEARLSAQHSEELPPPEEQDGILMFKLRGVRNDMGLSTYELASYARVPHHEYVAIENLEAKANEEAQFKLVNGVWRAWRRYRRDLASVVM